jgi:hypothetical protein
MGQKLLYALVGLIAVVAVGGGGYLLGTHHQTATTSGRSVSGNPTEPSSSTSSTSAPNTTVTSTATQLEISVQPADPNNPSAPDSSQILLPSSCSLSNGVVTATGTFNGGFVPESYIRIGAVVELYVYSSPAGSASQGTQLAVLGNEHPAEMGGTGPWTVTAPLDTQLGMTPASCQVDVQQTHNFEGAGNAGG